MLVTGASRGIGQATARSLRAAGCRVALTARRAERLEALVVHFQASLSLPADITDQDAVDGFVEDCLERWSRIDVLVNSAGVMPVVLQQGSGHIVNISSLASRRPFPNGAVYSATKSPVRAI